MKRASVFLVFGLLNLFGYTQHRYDVLPVAKEGCILFVGNNITDDCEWSELFENPNILSRGIDGNTTYDVLARTPELTRHKPSKVFLGIGTNDIAAGIPIDSTMLNMNKIIQQFAAESPETQIYIQSVLPVGHNPMFIHSPHNNAGVLALNERYKLLCNKHNITFIDLHSHFVGEDGFIKPEYTNDDLHMLGKGFLLWKSLIIEYVNE